MGRTNPNIMRVKDYYELCPIEKRIVDLDISGIAKKIVEDGHSISVCIRRTYLASGRHTLQLVDAVIRCSDVMEYYDQKHKLKRALKKFDMNEYFTELGFEKIV